DQQAASTQERTAATARVPTIPGPSPESTSQRLLSAVAAIEPRRGLLGHRVQELVEIERIDAAVWCKDRAGSGRDFIPDDLGPHRVPQLAGTKVRNQGAASSFI